MSDQSPSADPIKMKPTSSAGLDSSFDPSTSLSSHPHEGTQPSAKGSTADLPERFGRYRVQEKLGQGGMGAVYLAEDTVLKRLVALKVPQFDPRHAEQMQARFIREAQIAAQLSQHPNVCQVYDVGEVDGRLCMAMEYVDGRSSSTAIRDRQM